MKTAFLIATVVAVAFIGHATCWTSSDTGAGTKFKLEVTQDSWLEGGNKNNYDWILTAKAFGFSKKRALVQMEDLPTGSGGCGTIVFAKLYLYYAYSGKASWHSPAQAPFISRPLKVYQVNKAWEETQVTQTSTGTGVNWDTPYLNLGGPDAGPGLIDDSVTLHTADPSGWMKFDVTEAVQNWKNGVPNNGLLIMATNENTDGRDVRFYSKQYSDASKRPFINVLCQP